MGPSPRFSIVVPTRDRGHLLVDCLTSLLAQDAPGGVEVVVVDDGSTDATAALLDALAGQADLTVVRREGGGANAARNAGWRAARGDWVWFVDDDEVAPPERLAGIAARIDADHGLAALGGPVRESDPPPFRTCARCSLGSIDLPETERREPWRLLAGNMVVRRRLFEEVGGFDEALRGIGEESEWFHRLGDRRIVYDPELWLWHRKDHLSLRAALVAHYRAGRNIPAYRRRTGRRSGPSLRAVLRSLAHAGRAACWKGVLTAAREVGHAVAHVRQGGGPGAARATRDSG